MYTLMQHLIAFKYSCKINHWSTDNYSKHLLFDRLNEDIDTWVDEIAETIKNGDEINVVVPTGNFGNILAAYYAKEMGVPMKKLICASNANNVLSEFFKSGVYNKNRDFHITKSPSMDILISSNLERLLYFVAGSGTVVNCMKSLSDQFSVRVCQ